MTVWLGKDLLGSLIVTGLDKLIECLGNLPVFNGVQK